MNSRGPQMLWILLSICLFLPVQATADRLALAGSDQRLLYLYGDPATIDWATLWRLNTEQGVRIDLVRLRTGSKLIVQQQQFASDAISSYDLTLDPAKGAQVDSARARLWQPQAPDIVVIDLPLGSSRDSLTARLLPKPGSKAGLFSLRRVFHRLEEPSSRINLMPLAIVPHRSVLAAHEDEVAAFAKRLFPDHAANPNSLPVSFYQLSWSSDTLSRNLSDLTDQIEPFRLPVILTRLLPGGAVREALVRRAEKYRALLAAARIGGSSENGSKVDLASSALREMGELRGQAKKEKTLASIPELQTLLATLELRAEQAALEAAGVNFSGQILVRESPQGLRLKYRAELSVFGSSPIEISAIRFQPYWQTERITLDSNSHVIAPHQSFVREYLVEIDPKRLAGKKADSLRFSADLVYGRIPLTIGTALPTREELPLAVAFLPSFRFVSPVARVEIDKTVGQLSWMAQITKPEAYSGPVKLYLETPRGLFAGAYRQDVMLHEGGTSELISIPFSLSNLFELGTQPLSISIRRDDKLIAADSAIIRIAECKLSDRVKIALLPDSSGLLEEVIRMTGASYQVMTDRSLLTADLSAYPIMMIGSGAFERYAVFSQIASRLEEFVRFGGTLLVMGQPERSRLDALPVSLIPKTERLTLAHVEQIAEQSDLLTSPYLISHKNLLAGLSESIVSSPATVAPAEKIIAGPANRALLSQSRIGDGRVIYCGLPLLALISQLNIESIHLLANLLNSIR